MLIREGDSKKEKITNAADVFELLKDEMRAEAQEVMKVMCLNTRNEVIGITEVSRGTVSSSLIHPREIFRTAILSNATSIIMVHNHPSGDPKPSDDDISITRKLTKASEIIMIEILDHVIIGEKYYSFKEEDDM